MNMHILYVKHSEILIALNTALSPAPVWIFLCI